MHLPRYLALYHKKWHYANNYAIFFGKFTKVYVAVVSDNDGSAFITKAEFDSLKNNFQAQIDNYNQSIDSKIDGAIASYLAGIKVNTDDTPEYSIGGKDSGGTYGHMGRASICAFWTANGQFQSGSSSAGQALVMPGGTTSSDLGFGYGYWVTGLFGSMGVHTLSSDEIAVGHDKTYCQDNIYKYCSYKLSDSGAIQVWNMPNYMTKKMIANKAYSQAVGEFVALIEPTFTLYNFYDEGDVSFKGCYIEKGFSYDHRSGGRDPNATGLRQALQLMHEAADGTITWLWGNKRGTSYEWTDDNAERSWTIHVKAGDKIKCFFRCDVGGNVIGSYSIFYFQRDLAGWKMKKT